MVRNNLNDRKKKDDDNNEFRDCGQSITAETYSMQLEHLIEWISFFKNSLR